jgi:excisionase family DNA binding protein
MTSLLTVKQVCAWLNMKQSTLYLWASQGRIPCRKIYGLIRFEQHELEKWLASFAPSQQSPFPLPLARGNSTDVDELIAAARRDVYTPRHGETITPSPMGKEEGNGTR